MFNYKCVKRTNFRINYFFTKKKSTYLRTDTTYN